MAEFTSFAASPIPVQPSPESVRLLKRAAIFRRGLERARTHGLSLWSNRLLMNSFTLLARPPKGGSATWKHYDNGVRGRLAAGPDANPANGILLWVPGGGFIAGHPLLEQQLAVAYAATARIPVFLPRYRMPPEYPFPAAADDVLAAYRCLLHQGFPADQIRVGGLSAGGALAIGLLGDIGRSGLPMPAAALLLSPVIQLSAESAHRRDAQQSDPFCSPDFMERTSKAYAGDTPLSDPRLDYLAADMRDWPPVLVQVGGTECIVPEAELLGAAMHAAGSRCEIQVWPGQVHGFAMIGARKVPEAKAAIEYGSQFLGSVSDYGR